LEGKTVNIQDYVGKGKPVVFSFWATWCIPCQKELDIIADMYPEWQDKGVELLAITIDDARQLAKVPGMVASKGWEYTVLSDSKQQLQRAMNFQAVPQTFLVDGAGNIVYAHSGYQAGDEIELEDKILDLLGE
jgi:cytochrome c biogenesis protein CcmG/thiol:disulfide interchange protein DsbE